MDMKLKDLLMKVQLYVAGINFLMISNIFTVWIAYRPSNN